MKIKVDENLPVEAVQMLRSLGVEADSVYDEGLAGSPDDLIAEHLLIEHLTLLTLDRDFSDIRTYAPSRFHGIIILRPRLQDNRSVLSLVSRVASLLESAEVEGHLWIVHPDRVRIT